MLLHILTTAISLAEWSVVKHEYDNLTSLLWLVGWTSCKQPSLLLLFAMESYISNPFIHMWK